MTKAVYDSNNDGIVNAADKIAGIETVGNKHYYGTNLNGNTGFFEIPDPDLSLYFTKDEINAILFDYYLKTETYSQSEIDDLINNIPVVDLTGYYTKLQVDAIFALYYTKTEISTILSNYYTISQVYTKTEVDNLVTTTLNNYYTKTQVYTKAEVIALNNLTNYFTKSQTYSSTDIDLLFNNLANVYYSKSQVYNKTETYTKAEIANLIAAIPPTDLSNYYTKTQTEDRLKAFVVSDIAARNALTGKYVGMYSYVISTNKNYQLQGGIADSNWVDLSTDLSNYYNKTEVYTKSQVDAAIPKNFNDITKYYQAQNNFILGVNPPYNLSASLAASFAAQGTGDTSPIASPLILNGYGKLTLNAGTGSEYAIIASYQGGSVNSNNLYASKSEYLYGFSWIGLRQNWATQNSVVTITGFINQNGWSFPNGFASTNSGYYFKIYANSSDANSTFRYQLVAAASASLITTVTPSSNTLTVGNAYFFEVILKTNTVGTPYCEYRINGVSVGTITTNINNSSVLNHVAIGSSRNTGTGSGSTYVIDCGLAGFRQKYLTPLQSSSFYLTE
ncbi:MAG: hypothetical protein EBU90_01650 [Proteobacteria bacterium]|nr:hypothetical protein [Pseudomonadota bacterium]